MEVIDTAVVRSNYVVKLDEGALQDAGFRTNDQVVIKVMKLGDLDSGKFCVTEVSMIRQDWMVKLSKRLLTEKGIYSGHKVIIKVLPMDVIQQID